MTESSFVRLPSDECHWTNDNATLVGAIRQQAITWTNVDQDPCRHMATLGHNELNVIQPIQCNHQIKCYIPETWICKLNHLIIWLDSRGVLTWCVNYCPGIPTCQMSVDNCPVYRSLTGHWTMNIRLVALACWICCGWFDIRAISNWFISPIITVARHYRRYLIHSFTEKSGFITADPELFNGFC